VTSYAEERFLRLSSDEWKSAANTNKWPARARLPSLLTMDGTTYITARVTKIFLYGYKTRTDSDNVTSDS